MNLRPERKEGRIVPLYLSERQEGRAAKIVSFNRHLLCRQRFPAMAASPFPVCAWPAFGVNRERQGSGSGPTSPCHEGSQRNFLEACFLWGIAELHRMFVTLNARNGKAIGFNFTPLSLSPSHPLLLPSSSQLFPDLQSQRLTHLIS